MTRVYLIQLQTDMLTMQVCVPLAPLDSFLCLFILVTMVYNFSVSFWIGFEQPVGWSENTNVWGLDGQYVQQSVSAYLTLWLML
jgi:hypothetical protein